MNDTLLAEQDNLKFYALKPDSGWWNEIIEFGNVSENSDPAEASIGTFLEQFRTTNGITILASNDNEFAGCICTITADDGPKESGRQYFVVNDRYRSYGLKNIFRELSEKYLHQSSAFFARATAGMEDSNKRKALESRGFYQTESPSGSVEAVHALHYEKCLYHSTAFRDIKKLGILGGMGSNASARFLSGICALTSQTEKEQDQLPIILNSATYIPDRTELLLSGRRKELADILAGEISNLLQNKVSHIVICCFSFHAVLNDIPASLKEKVVSLIDYTNDLLALKKGKYLLLATKGSYQLNNLAATNTLYYPKEEDQEKIHTCIYRIKKGEAVAIVLLDLEKVLCAYECDGLVLGCTDLLLIGDHIEHHFHHLDTINPLKVMTYDMVNSWRQNQEV